MSTGSRGSGSAVPPPQQVGQGLRACGLGQPGEALELQFQGAVDDVVQRGLPGVAEDQLAEVHQFLAASAAAALRAHAEQAQHGGDGMVAVPRHRRLHDGVDGVHVGLRLGAEAGPGGRFVRTEGLRAQPREGCRRSARHPR